jgi:hypothetical protein
MRKSIDVNWECCSTGKKDNGLDPSATGVIRRNGFLMQSKKGVIDGSNYNYAILR